MNPLDLNRNTYRDNIILCILFGFVLLYFYKLGYPSIWNPNEAFYAETPREMIETKDFLTPRFNYEYRFQKPPLMYWLVLPWYALLGYTEAAVRMVSALSAVLGVVVTYRLGKAVWNDKRSGLISAAVLASAFDYNSAARYASPEMLLTALTTCSLALFYKGYTDNSDKKGLWYFLFYILCGFSTLAKGPIGVIQPFLVIIPFLLVKKDFREFKHIVSIKGILGYLLISSPWYAYMIKTHGETFYSVVSGENVARFVKKKSGTSSLFFYFTVLPWNFFPGSVFIIPAFIWVKRNVKRYGPLAFPLVWVSAVFVFFSLSKSKLPPYIYALFPPLSILVGGWLNIAVENAREGKILTWITPIVLFSIIAGIVWIRTYLPDIHIFYIAVPSYLFLDSLWNIRKKKFFTSLAFSLVGMSMFYFVFLTDIVPQIEEYRHYREIGRTVKDIDSGKKSKFYAFDGYQRNLSFYLERKIERVHDRSALTGAIKTEKNAFFLLKEKTYRENFSSFGKEIIWKGPFYNKSESRFMRYLMDIKNNKIEEYVIIG